VRIVLSLFLNLTELSWIRNFNLLVRGKIFAAKIFTRRVVMYECVCKLGGERGKVGKWLSDLAEERRYRGG